MSTFDLNDLEQFDQFLGESKAKIELTNAKGDVAIMELEPLDVRYFGKIIYVQDTLPRPKLLNPKEHKAGRPAIYEDPDVFQKRLTEDDYKSYSMMCELLSAWIKQSYPSLTADRLNKFVSLNFISLFESFMKLHNDVDVSGKTKELKEFIKSKQSNEDTQTVPTTETKTTE